MLRGDSYFYCRKGDGVDLVEGVKGEMGSGPLMDPGLGILRRHS